MLKAQVGVRSLIKEPSAFFPLAMSLTGLALVVFKVLVDVATHGAVVREADEGIAAHLWQLLMAGQVPVVAFFAIKWLRRAPGEALRILALQTVAALASLAAVFFLRL
jgi:hypothetical protein